MPGRLTNRVAWASCCHSPSAHPVSTKALLAVHRRMTTGIGPPQVGQQATHGAGCARRVGVQSTRWAGTIIRRRVSGGMAQRACRKPQCRTFMEAIGEDMGEESAEKLDGVEGGGA